MNKIYSNFQHEASNQFYCLFFFHQGISIAAFPDWGARTFAKKVETLERPSLPKYTPHCMRYAIIYVYIFLFCILFDSLTGQFFTSNVHTVKLGLSSAPQFPLFIIESPPFCITKNLSIFNFYLRLEIIVNKNGAPNNSDSG